MTLLACTPVLLAKAFLLGSLCGSLVMALALYVLGRLK